MIKSSHKQYNNAYRILKVLENRDFLAIDRYHHYCILTVTTNLLSQMFPVPLRKYKSSNKPKQQPRNMKLKQENVLQYRQFIEIDRIYYYVFGIDSQNIRCAKYLDKSKFNSHSYCINFISVAIRNILSFLLKRKISEARQVIDINNALIIDGQLFLMMVPRGRNYPKSLQRSEKKLNLQSSQQRSLSRLLQDELAIIRQFGLLLWQIIYDEDYSQVKLKKQKTFTYNILYEMIKKKITYQYIELRLFQKQKQTIIVSKQKRISKFNAVGLKNYHKYRTQQTINNPRYSLDHKYHRISSDKKKTLQSPNNIKFMKILPKISNKKQFLYSSIQRKIYSKLEVQQTYKNKSISNEKESVELNSLHINAQRKDTLGIREKLIKQSEIAKKKFKGIIESERQRKLQKSAEKQQISEDLRIRLISRIHRFKTQLSHYPNYNATKDKQTLSTNSLQIHTQQNHIKRQLFEDNKIENYHTIQTEKQDGKMKVGVQQKQNQKKLRKRDDSFLKISSKQIQLNIRNNQQNQLFKDNAIQQIKSNTMIQKVVIPYSGTKIINQQIEKNHESQNNQQKLQFPTIKLTNQRQQPLIQIFQDQSKHIKLVNLNNGYNFNDNKIKKEQKISKQINNNKKQIKQFCFQDQIQEIIINKHTIIHNNKHEQRQMKQQKRILHTNTVIQKKENKKYHNVVDSVEEYLTMINILGKIAAKTIMNKHSLGQLEWRIVIYFIYERFLIERQKMNEALTLGAKNIFRNYHVINDEQWDIWKQTQKRRQLSDTLRQQNIKIREQLNKFTARILKQYKLDRKVSYMIRNRQKLVNQDRNQISRQLTKHAISSLIQLYQQILQKGMNNSAVIELVLDCIFGVKICSELDGYKYQNWKVRLTDYQQYTYEKYTINTFFEDAHKLYFSDNQFTNKLQLQE